MCNRILYQISFHNSFQKAFAKKAALKGGLDKTVSLRKDLSEMHEWITQAEEEYLERDFEYKTPDELQKAVEELKVKDRLTYLIYVRSSWNRICTQSVCSFKRVAFLYLLGKSEM